jgi:hypothetical protein
LEWSKLNFAAVKTKGKIPLAAPHSRKNRSEGVGAKNKNKKSKIHERLRNARLHVALQRRLAASGQSFHPQSE